MSSTSNPDVLFHEQQQFRQKWLWVLLLLVAFTPAVAVLGYGLVKQVLLGQAWGSEPMSNTLLVWIFVLVFILDIALLWLFYWMALIIEVRSDALLIHFRPFLRRRIAYSDIKTCEVRQYSPIKEYGGWGIRFGRRGRAYNISGNQGVQLELNDGKRIMLGSQRAQALAAAILDRCG